MSVRIVIWPVHLSPSHWRTLVFKPTSPFWSFKELKNPSQLVFSSEYELQSGARSAFRCLSRVQPVRLHAFRTLPGLWEPPDLPFPCCLAVLFQTLRQRKLFVIGEYIRDIRERGENLLLLTLEHNHTYVGVSDIFVTGKNIFHFLPLCVTFKKSVSVFLLPLFGARHRNSSLSSELCRVLTIYGRVSCLVVTSWLCLNLDNSHAPPPHPRRKSLVSCFVGLGVYSSLRTNFAFFCAHCPKRMKERVLAAKAFFFFGRLRDCFLCGVIAARTKRPLNDFSKMYEAGRWPVWPCRLTWKYLTASSAFVLWQCLNFIRSRIRSSHLFAAISHCLIF